MSHPVAEQVIRLQQLAGAMRRRIEFIENSRFWKIRKVWIAVKSRFGFPVEIAPTLPAAAYIEVAPPSESYARWLLAHEPRVADLQRLCSISDLLVHRPAVTIVVDDFHADAKAAIESVHMQIYPNVRLILTSQMRRYEDAAVRYNAALASSDDDIIAFCDADEILSPDAAFEIALAFNRNPSGDVFYGDRDVLDPDGHRHSPLFLPDWSPDTFLSHMYTGRLLFYRRSTVLSSGGYRKGFGTALHYDLALRITEQTDRIIHCARILYHESRQPQKWHGLALSGDAARAVESALERRGEPGRLEPVAGFEGANLVRYTISRRERVEIIVPTRDLPDFLERCLDSAFARSNYRDINITVADNGSKLAATEDILNAWKAREPNRFHVLRIDEPFNFSRIVNTAVRRTSGPYIVLLNNDTEILTPDWIEAMVEQAQRKAIGAVGARLLYPDQTVQHAGVVVGLGSLAGHIYRGAAAGDPGPGGALVTIRNYSALTAACLMVRRELFDAVNGFDESLAVEFNDVDFCLRLFAKGYRNVYLPHVVLLHHESKSRGGHPPKLRDRLIFTNRWNSTRYADPYYNRNLTLLREDASLDLD